jgi:hypothetical protein
MQGRRENDEAERHEKLKRKAHEELKAILFLSDCEESDPDDVVRRRYQIRLPRMILTRKARINYKAKWNVQLLLGEEDLCGEGNRLKNSRKLTSCLPRARRKSVRRRIETQGESE